jgi:trehalose synthase-fused probable maltokinase
VSTPPLPDEQTLLAYVVERRWFGSKSREVSHARILEAPVLREGSPALVLAIVEIGFQPGTHELYQLPLGLWPGDPRPGAIDHRDGWSIVDALEDPELTRALTELMGEGATVDAEHGQLEFRGDPVGEVREIRPIGVEQSNTSLVLDDRLIFKVYRRLEAGINPELELLRFLTDRGFPNVPALTGWYGYAGSPMDATLGVLQEFVRGESDGWELALESLSSNPESFVARAERLGQVTGAMHTVLGSEHGDAAFCPEEPSSESLALLVASVDEDIERLFAQLPPDAEELGPIANRGEEVREQLRLISSVGPFGRVIRNHGDYHLGQVIWTGDDWLVIDFEGEPARSLPERRRKRSPLRDVAGMLRSIAYAANASALTRGVDPPEGWEERVRETFLEGYLAAVDSSLLPPGREAIDRLLTVFELEKAVYELRYELDNRPDWVVIPVLGIARLLDGATVA